MTRRKISELDKRRLKLILFSKNIIMKNGWNKNLFYQISIESKIDSNSLYLLFPNGYKDMLIFTLHNLNSDFEKKFNRSKIKKLPIHKRIKTILMDKIFFIDLEKDFYKKIYYYLLLPNNYKLLSSQIYKSVDSIWYIAMDKSTDFNYYTKRIILSGIYSSILFHYFNNDNVDETEKKLDKFLAMVSKIPTIKKNVNFFTKKLPSLFKLFGEISY